MPSLPGTNVWIHALRDRSPRLRDRFAAMQPADIVVVLQARATPSAQPTEVRLRVVARPDRPVAELLQRLGLDLPTVPKRVQNVVEKTTL